MIMTKMQGLLRKTFMNGINTNYKYSAAGKNKYFLLISFFFSTAIQSTKAASNMPTFETLSITTPKEFVYQVQLNRPKKLNAFNNDMWL